MDKEKNVYIVIYNFPPIGIGRGIAWNYFANKLSDAGYKVTVITVDPSKKDPYYNEDKFNLINNARYKIVRIKDSKFYYYVYSKNNTKTENVSKGNNNDNYRVRLKKLLIKLYRIVTRIVFYPDRMVFWSKKVGKYIKNQKIDSNSLIISVGFPFSTHLEMKKIKKKTNCKLILDYGDPWSFNPSVDTEPKWRRKFDKYKEKELLNEVDYVTVTTERTSETFKQNFNISNIEVIRQGVKNKDYIKNIKRINENINMVYTGIFYKEIRDPSKFFAALKQVDKKIDFPVKIVIAGRIDAYFEDVINDLQLDSLKNINIDFLGNVGLNKCIDLQNMADILLFFSNKNSVQVPGKLYEYLATDKPILSISYDIGETENIIQKHNRGIVVLNDSNMADRLLELLNTYNKNNKFPGLNYAQVEEYDWENISNKMLKIVERVCKNEENNNS